MKTKSKYRSLFAGILLGTAGVINAYAQNSYIMFSVNMSTNILNGTFIQGTDTVWVEGTFDGWSGGTQLAQEGKSTVYTNTVQDTKDVNGGHAEYKFIIDLTGTATWETGFPRNSNGSDNRVVALPASSGATVTPPPPFFNEAGHP